MNRALIPPKKQGEVVFCPPQGWDFTSALAAGETISSVSLAVLVWSGVDSNPSSMLSGSPTINGPVVMQLYTGGQIGTIYALSCQATTSLGQTVTAAGYLVVPFGPVSTI